MVEFGDRLVGQIKHPVASVDADSIQQAKTMRARRDARYRNLYSVSATDARWVCDLGEIVFDRWLQGKKIAHQWLAEDDAAGKHDFEISGTKIWAKTVKRTVPMMPDYTAQITARHAHEPTDQFFLCALNFRAKSCGYSVE